jgi:hypothetical protein
MSSLVVAPVTAARAAPVWRSSCGRTAAVQWRRRPGGGQLAGIPAALVHGRLDIGGPPDVPWLLARSWPGVEVHLVHTGHQGGEEMTAVMLAALDR